jgi:energy-coupling factor transporter ATP-binding protein EcfA2
VLRELRVENYAVIDNVVVEFGTGLNLLTGETGAGKSILIDALALLLGEKAYSDVVRHGAEKATVAAVYESDDPAIAEVLEENGIDSAGTEIILRRDIAINGKGRAQGPGSPTCHYSRAKSGHSDVRSTRATGAAGRRCWREFDRSLRGLCEVERGLAQDCGVGTG